MLVYRTKNDLSGHLDSIRKEASSIALVPTMGALHAGHASLVEKARQENDVVIVSIFVNPTQFDDPADLESYPRTLDQDLILLRELDVNLAFVPSVKEIYAGEELPVFDLSPLDQVLEGRYRKGHFNGVAQIVSKLLQLTLPDRAYFGQKDFQQLVIVRRLTALLRLKTEIVACPTVREKDGLAMSSRNVHLKKDERKLAPHIYRILKEAVALKASHTPSEIKSWAEERFREYPEMELEYFEIVEDQELKPLFTWRSDEAQVACLAVHLGQVRLIDNLQF